VSLREIDIQKRLKEEIAKHEWYIMMAAPCESQFLAVLCKMINAKNVIGRWFLLFVLFWSFYLTLVCHFTNRDNFPKKFLLYWHAKQK